MANGKLRKARARILVKLSEIEGEDNQHEFEFHISDQWSRRLFLEVCKQHGLVLFRYSRQRRTTTPVIASFFFFGFW
jgi:hypothetical protein